MYVLLRDVQTEERTYGGGLQHLKEENRFPSLLTTDYQKPAQIQCLVSLKTKNP